MSLGIKVGVLAALLAGALIFVGCITTSEGSIDWHIIHNTTDVEDVVG